MTIIKVKRVFRNNVCGCGSGKKSKICCKSVNEYNVINNSNIEEKPIDNKDNSEDNT